MAMPLRPWSPIPIQDCGEPLDPLAPTLWKLEPHPYVALGAPYGPDGNPYLLRSGVVVRLLQAQQALQLEHPELRLAIFDGWRPLAVQSFMVKQALSVECLRVGVDPDSASHERDQVAIEVGRFWAPPSADPATPPPHSTGAAVDLTLASLCGEPLAMGGAIDTIGPISEPGFHAEAARLDPGGDAARWHRHRQWLATAMGAAGFVQHPNEWWHFSWGDQLWAWRSGAGQARYGSIGSDEIGKA